MVRRSFFDNEMKLHHAPELQGFGFSMVGPAIINYGTDQQKEYYLPKILSAEISWCQGYSEPGAGSDLASVQTRAKIDGDEYVVTGSKTWTSAAEKVDAAEDLGERQQAKKELAVVYKKVAQALGAYEAYLRSGPVALRTIDVLPLPSKA